MNRIIAKIYFLTSFLGLCLNGFGQSIDSYKIREGTLEVVGQTYVFRAGTDVETFDLSLEGRGRESGVQEPGHPGPRGLTEIGFKTVTGELYSYEGKPRQFTLGPFLEKESIDKIGSLLFEAKGGHKVEIKLKGLTKVIRVDVRMSGTLVVLWSNREE